MFVYYYLILMHRMWSCEQRGTLHGAHCCPAVSKAKIYYDLRLPSKPSFCPNTVQCQSTGLVLILETVLEPYFGVKFDLCTNCVALVWVHSTQDSSWEMWGRSFPFEETWLCHMLLSIVNFFRMFCRAFCFLKSLSFKVGMHKSDSINPCQPKKKVE